MINLQLFEMFPNFQNYKSNSTMWNEVNNARVIQQWPHYTKQCKCNGIKTALYKTILVLFNNDSAKQNNACVMQQLPHYTEQCKCNETKTVLHRTMLMLLKNDQTTQNNACVIQQLPHYTKQCKCNETKTALHRTMLVLLKMTRTHKTVLVLFNNDYNAQYTYEAYTTTLPLLTYCPISQLIRTVI